MEEVLFKIHKSYRWVVAVCDVDVFGKKLMDKKNPKFIDEGVSPRVLDVSGEFFKGKKISIEEAKREIDRCAKEDATFNFVGENSVLLAKELDIVQNEGVIYIEGIPFALVLV